MSKAGTAITVIWMLLFIILPVYRVWKHPGKTTGYWQSSDTLHTIKFEETETGQGDRQTRIQAGEVPSLDAKCLTEWTTKAPFVERYTHCFWQSVIWEKIFSK